MCGVCSSVWRMQQRTVVADICFVTCCTMQLPSSQAVLVPTGAQPPMEPLTAQHAPQQQQQQGQMDTSTPSASSATITSSSSISRASGGPEQLFRLSPAGLDTVTLLLAAGPSEPLRPLADVASGGEAARVMLALKAAAAAVAAGSSDTTAVTAATAAAGGDAAAVGKEGGPPPVLVLDELDAGVGSRLGAPIGRLLQRLVAGREPTASQVLVVTHTPQVSAVGCFFSNPYNPVSALYFFLHYMTYRLGTGPYAL